MTGLNNFVAACTGLVGKIAANPALVDSIIEAITSGRLNANSGPMGINDVLKGAPGSHHLREFLNVWKDSAKHLDANDVSAMVKASMACYQLAQGRSHAVDAVWTGPEVNRSEVRRTEAVVNDIVANAKSELLIVGYWLVTGTIQVKELIELLIKKAREGVKIRFVFDPGEKSEGANNFDALNQRWPATIIGAQREVYSWSNQMTQATSGSGKHYDRKLHAKVIVADRHDALVTSANLTHAGLLENLEMGLRVQGITAGSVVKHFDLLISEGILELRG